MTSVLIVDDDFGVADALADVLADGGYEVEVARNGKDALKRMGERTPGVLVLDFMMPIMDGGAVLRAMGQDPALGDVPVLMISAAPRTSLPADCRPQAFLRKPFDADLLLATVRQLAP